MQAVITSIDAATGGVKIVWTEPSGGDGSDTITSYKIEIKDSSSNWIQETTNCGATLPALECIVPMSDLTTTFGLSFQDLVEVRASAGNSYGYGTASPVNTVGA